MGILRGCMGATLRRIVMTLLITVIEITGIQVLGSLASSSQTVRSLLRNPWPEKPAGQIGESFINNIQSGYFFITKIMFARE